MKVNGREFVGARPLISRAAYRHLPTLAERANLGGSK